METKKAKVIYLLTVLFGLTSSFSIMAQDTQKPKEKSSQAPSSTVAFDAQTRALLRHADYDRGARASQDCTDCHGEKGISNTGENPSLAGMRAEYIYKQLMDFKTGSRTSDIMQPTVEDLDQGTIANLALYFSRQKPPQRNANEKMSEHLKKLIIFGDPERLLHACSSCHGTKGQGGQFDFPVIAGQSKDYFIKTMLDFKSGARKNDIYSRMRLIAKELTEKEIQALAQYYAQNLPEEE